MRFLFRSRKILFLCVYLTLATPLVLSPLNPLAHALQKGQPLPSDLFIRLAKKVNPAVVNISTSSHPKVQRQRRRQYRDPFFDMFEPFLNPHGIPQQRRSQKSLGTGFIIRKDGLIITNNHVIDKADIINVSLSNSKEIYTAKIVGKDHRTDTALIKITAKKSLPFVELGDSDKLQVGEWVASFGNPFGHTNSMSKGIISAIGREISELNRFPFLQTDASINPGNSGGPLVNMEGQVIGVNTAIDARAQGIGFAIPINNIKAILPSLEKDGGIRRGFLGVNLRDVSPEVIASLGLKSTDGALITNVLTQSPAAKAGLKPYDFITHFNGKKINSAHNLVDAVADAGVGKSITVKLIRDSKSRTLKVSLVPHPQDRKLERIQTKSYRGQKAPFDLGFSVIDYKKALKEKFKLPTLNKPHPVVIDVISGSPAQRAGLYHGVIILDINRKPVYTARDVLRRLKKSKTNVLRILRGEQVDLLYLSPK